jgi:hypothetical protein
VTVLKDRLREGFDPGPQGFQSGVRRPGTVGVGVEFDHPDSLTPEVIEEGPLVLPAPRPQRLEPGIAVVWRRDRTDRR